jgi:putative ABC transport system permease protein
MNTIWNDIRYGIRMLLKNPGFTLVIVLVLSLGISVSVAMFGLIDRAAHPALCFPDPDRIVHILADGEFSGRKELFTYLDCLALREQLTSLSGLATINTAGAIMKKDGWSREHEAAEVSRNFFSLAQVKAHLGYMFSENDSEELKNQPSVVLSHRLWKSHFDSDPEIIGQSILLSDVNRIVLGVAPSWFRSALSLESVIDFWIPMDSWDETENYTFQEVIGRLRPEASIPTLQIETEIAFRKLNLRNPDTLASLKPLVMSDRDYHHVSGYGIETIFLLGIADVVLLIACLNVSGLLLAKAHVRRREMAVRQALGGSHGRIMRQLLTEGALLATLALGMSLLMTYWFTSWVRSRYPAEIAYLLRVDFFNPRVIGFSLSITLITTLLFELLPAWYSCKTDLVPVLKGGRNSHARFGRKLCGLPVLVVLQLAMALVLAVCAGHFLRSYLNIISIDLGFKTENVLLACNLRPNGNIDQNRAFFRDLVARVQKLPGVENVGLGLQLPIHGRDGRRYNVSLHDDNTPTNGRGEKILANIVDPGYFPTMGVPILKGRNFPGELGPSNSRKVLVNQTFASRFWPDKDPVGRYIQLEDLDGDSSTTELAQVVGVVRDVRMRPIQEAPHPNLYVSFGQVTFDRMTLLIETRQNPHALAVPIQKIIQQLDHTVHVYSMTTLAEEVRNLSSGDAFGAQLLGSLSLFGLSLACVGLYGIIAFTVTRRTYELGVRMALGAERQDVMRIVMSQGLKLGLIGLGIGLIGSVILTLALRAIMVGMTPFDPAVFMISSVVVLFTAMLAAYVPARRAAKIDPMEALRYE